MALLHNALVNDWGESLSAETRRAYVREVGRALDAIAQPLDVISPSDVAEYLATRQAATSTRHLIVSALRGFFRFARDAGEIDRDPRLPHPTDRPPNGPRPALSTHDPHLVAGAAASERDRALVNVIYGAALRPAEVAQLRWRGVVVTASSPSLVVCAHAGAAARTVRIRATLYADLIRLRRAAPDDAFVFGITARQIRRIVAAAGARAGIANVSPRQLRDAHIVRALKCGAASEDVCHTIGREALSARVYCAAKRRPKSDYIMDL